MPQSPAANKPFRPKGPQANSTKCANCGHLVQGESMFCRMCGASRYGESPGQKAQEKQHMEYLRMIDLLDEWKRHEDAKKSMCWCCMKRMKRYQQPTLPEASPAPPPRMIAPVQDPPRDPKLSPRSQMQKDEAPRWPAHSGLGVAAQGSAGQGMAPGLGSQDMLPMGSAASVDPRVLGKTAGKKPKEPPPPPPPPARGPETAAQPLLGKEEAKSKKVTKTTGGKKNAAAKAGKKAKAKGKSKTGATMNHGALVYANPGAVRDVYEMKEDQLGEGTFGSVCIGTNKVTGAKRAIKTIVKKEAYMERFRLEIVIMTKMDHPNIIKFYEHFEDKGNFYLVMELCDGGELFDRITELETFTEVQAATVIQMVIKAVLYMHNQRVSHRDLKPENFILATKAPIETNTLKVIDFGISRMWKEGEVLPFSSKIGTPFYLAPDVLNGNYDHRADLWSIGAITYLLLSGSPPFTGDDNEEIMDAVCEGEFTFDEDWMSQRVWRGEDKSFDDFEEELKFLTKEQLQKKWDSLPVADHDSPWVDVSEEGKDFIVCLLQTDPNDRYNAEQALNHPWILAEAPKAVLGDSATLRTGLIGNLRKFQSQNKFKKAVLHVLASQMDTEKIADLRDIFLALDVNCDGLLTQKEIENGLKQSGWMEIPQDLKEILDAVDADNSGSIDYTEFLAAALDKRMYMQEDILYSAFKVFDRNGDGVIDEKELKQILGVGDLAMVSQDSIVQIINEIDTNNDGQVDFEEFKTMMRGGRLSQMEESVRNSVKDRRSVGNQKIQEQKPLKDSNGRRLDDPKYNEEEDDYDVEKEIELAKARQAAKGKGKSKGKALAEAKAKAKAKAKVEP